MQTMNNSFIQQLHARVFTLFCICSLLYFLLAVRFVGYQALPHGPGITTRDLRIMRLPARRGDICDRNGIPLAVSVDGFDVWVRPNLIRKLNIADKVVPALSRTLQLPPAYIQTRLNLAKPFAFVKRRVSRAGGVAVQALDLPGVGADPVFLRAYPQGALAAQVIGRVNTDDVGTAGLEVGFNQDLQGQDGAEQFLMDGRGQMIPGTDKILRKVHNGRDIRLTIDSRIQQVAEAQLQKTIQDHRAAAGCTVVMDVPTGEILAMASWPTYDPNLPVKDMSALLNRNISFAYEPGSTMKMITASGALTEKAWSKTDTVTCRGSIMIGRRRIRCVVDPPYHGGHGVETIRDVLRNSCNVGAATIGMRLGAAKLYKYIQRFGLLDLPGLGLPGAVAYRLSSPESWARVRLANIAFGQGIMLTPLQLCTAYGATANDGILMKAHVVMRMNDPDTGLNRQILPERVRRVMPSSVAADIRSMLESVVYNGTGKTCEIPGYVVAGKTGSAQMAGNHGYISGKYIPSFVGFAPATNPRVVCLTMVDEPQGIHWGAVVAAPVVREVLRWSLHYLQVEPDAPDLTADGGDFKTVRQLEHLGLPLPGSSGWEETHPRPVLPPDATIPDDQPTAGAPAESHPLPSPGSIGDRPGTPSGAGPQPPPLRKGPGYHRGVKTV